MNPVHRVDDQTARIELTQGYAALVDQASLWLLLPYRWCVHKVRGKFIDVVKDRYNIHAEL
jgi:hypothetical protein